MRKGKRGTFCSSMSNLGFLFHLEEAIGANTKPDISSGSIIYFYQYKVNWKYTTSYTIRKHWMRLSVVQPLDKSRFPWHRLYLYQEEWHQAQEDHYWGKGEMNDRRPLDYSLVPRGLKQPVFWLNRIQPLAEDNPPLPRRTIWHAKTAYQGRLKQLVHDQFIHPEPCMIPSPRSVCGIFGEPCSVEFVNTIAKGYSLPCASSSIA